MADILIYCNILQLKPQIMKYPEPEALTSVAKFHETFDLPIRSAPAIPAADRCALRINLLEEELQELKEAIAQGDIVEAADAFADLQYVLSGAILEFGLGSHFKTLFDEVQRSNMSKVCETREIAEATLEYYRKNKNMDGVIVEKNGFYLVYRSTDQKVLKSVDYSAAKLDQIIQSLTLVE